MIHIDIYIIKLLLIFLLKSLFIFMLIGIAHAARGNQDFLRDMVEFQSGNTDRTQSVLQQGIFYLFKNILLERSS